VRLSVLVPTFNAAEFIENTYADIRFQVDKLGVDYEFLFRDDCSTDDTREKLRAIAGQDKKVRLFFNEQNMGLGYNLGRLFEDAKGDIAVYFDADLSFDVKRLPDFLERVASGKVDVCVGSKYKGIRGKIPLNRLVPSRVYYAINRLLFGVRVRDIGSGFVMVRKKCLSGIELKAKRFAVHIELFHKLSKKGCRIEEIPVRYIHQEGGSFKMLKHGPPTLLETLQYWWGSRNG
jgi:glycosyltransferase involved in cell wall biosynthesis